MNDKMGFVIEIPNQEDWSDGLRPPIAVRVSGYRRQVNCFFGLVVKVDEVINGEVYIDEFNSIARSK